MIVELTLLGGYKALSYSEVLLLGRQNVGQKLGNLLLQVGQTRGVLPIWIDFLALSSKLVAKTKMLIISDFVREIWGG